MHYPYLETTTKFRQIVDKIYVDGDKALRSKGLEFNISWYPVYKTLYQSTDMFSVNDLAAATGYTHIAVKNVLYALRDRGLITQQIDPEDKRSKLNSLTVRGRKLFEKTKSIWNQLERSLTIVFEPINPNLVYDIESLKEQFQQRGLYEIFENPVQPKARLTPITLNDIPLWESFIANAVRSEQDRVLLYEEKKLLKNPFQHIYPKGGAVYLLKDKQKIMGSIAVVSHGNNESEICFWYVSPTVQSQGLGYQLLKRGLSWARNSYQTGVWVQAPSKKNIENLLLRNKFKTKNPDKKLILPYQRHSIFFKYL